jgi:hypothetical protein
MEETSPMKELQAKIASVLIAVLVIVPMLMIGVNAMLHAVQ